MDPLCQQAALIEAILQDRNYELAQEAWPDMEQSWHGDFIYQTVPELTRCICWCVCK